MQSPMLPLPSVVRPVPTRRAWLRGILLGGGLAVLAAHTAGCHFTMVPQQPVNDPLRGVRTFLIEPFSYPALLVGSTPEPSYLARKDDKQRQSWQTDKDAAAQIFMQTALSIGASAGLQVQPPPPPGPGFFVLRPVVSFIEPGTFNGFFNKDTLVRVTLQILNDQMQPVDQVEFASQIRATLGNPSSGGRLRAAGQELAQQVMSMVTRRSVGR